MSSDCSFFYLAVASIEVIHIHEITVHGRIQHEFVKFSNGKKDEINNKQQHNPWIICYTTAGKKYLFVSMILGLIASNMDYINYLYTAELIRDFLIASDNQRPFRCLSRYLFRFLWLCRSLAHLLRHSHISLTLSSIFLNLFRCNADKYALTLPKY